MSLKIQLLSLGFSFVFGIIFSIFITINHKILFLSKKSIRVISNFLFLFDMALCYFLVIKYINGGILHIYFFIMLIIGWYVGNLILCNIRKK